MWKWAPTAGAPYSEGWLYRRCVEERLNLVEERLVGAIFAAQSENKAASKSKKNMLMGMPRWGFLGRKPAKLVCELCRFIITQLGQFRFQFFCMSWHWMHFIELRFMCGTSTSTGHLQVCLEIEFMGGLYRWKDWQASAQRGCRGFRNSVHYSCLAFPYI